MPIIHVTFLVFEFVVAFLDSLIINLQDLHAIYNIVYYSFLKKYLFFNRNCFILLLNYYLHFYFIKYN